MSIVQTFTVQVRENGIIYNGRQTYVWREQIRHRGPFGTALFNGSTWSFEDLTGSEIETGVDEGEAAMLCAWGVT